MKAVKRKRRRSPNRIVWKNVDAVGIERVGYDAGEQKLYIRFRNSGKTYIYFDLEEAMYKHLMNQEHKTTFLNKEIKGRYEYESFPDKKLSLE